jgi:hypothetical protein
VQDHIDPTDDVVDEGFVEDGTEDELDGGAAGVLAEVIVTPGRKIVEDDDRVATRYQCIDQVGADEAGPSGHQIFSHVLPPSVEASSFHTRVFSVAPMTDTGVRALQPSQEY